MTTFYYTPEVWQWFYELFLSIYCSHILEKQSFAYHCVFSVLFWILLFYRYLLVYILLILIYCRKNKYFEKLNI